MQFFEEAIENEEAADPWMYGKKPGKGFYFYHKLIIEAPLDEVWDIVSSPDKYETISNGAVRARLSDEGLVVGAPIDLDIFPGKFKSRLLVPHSKEQITQFDRNHKKVAWSRELPFNEGKTLRSHALVQETENQTISHLALFIPEGVAAFYTEKVVDKLVIEALKQLHEKIKEKAENPFVDRRIKI